MNLAKVSSAGRLSLLLVILCLLVNGETSNTTDAVLQWDLSTDDATIDGYRLYRSLDRINWTHWSNSPIFPPGTTSCTETGLVYGVTYYWSLTAFVNAGNTNWPDYPNGIESDWAPVVQYTPSRPPPTTPTLNIQ